MAQSVIIGLWRHSESEVRNALSVLSSLASAFNADDKEAEEEQVLQVRQMLEEECGIVWDGELPEAVQG